jgi:hypothetical protein
MDVNGVQLVVVILTFGDSLLVFFSLVAPPPLRLKKEWRDDYFSFS